MVFRQLSKFVLNSMKMLPEWNPLYSWVLVCLLYFGTCETDVCCLNAWRLSDCYVFDTIDDAWSDGLVWDSLSECILWIMIRVNCFCLAGLTV